MARIVRLLIVAFGALQLFGGIGLILTGHGEGLWLMAVGAFLVAIPLIERGRYRSADAEKAIAPAGPGGGEATGETIEARFRPTSEVFVDPTTGHRMRVLVDPRTGERRYVAEG
jgi:hypothetical protein